MSHKTTLDSRHSIDIDSCTIHLHSWRPFHVDSSDPTKPYSPATSTTFTLAKRPCLSDRATSFSLDSIDISKLSLVDDDRPAPYKRPSYRLLARKRRRRGSRSLSGRSSDRSGTRRCCSVGASAAQGTTCSDFPVAVGTDSSGELFVNGDANWASDVSEARNSGRREREREREREERENSGGGVFGNADIPGSESGYGSEPGYRGDGEFGYGDEVDEEDEDARFLFWGDYYGDTKMEMVKENMFSDQKTHYRCRRKKHDCRMVYSLR